MPLYKRSFRIASLDEWRRHAPPKSEAHWVEDRSAMEVARAWTEREGAHLPPEVLALLVSHRSFGEVQRWSGEPEAKLSFDSFPGEPRNTDIAVLAEDELGSYVLAVEAKADEPFGATIAAELADALERKLANPRSNGITCIGQLATAFLGKRDNGEVSIGGLRYQLLTATAGALCEAERKGFRRAVLLIHEFVTPKTTKENHDANAKDLRNFLSRIAHSKVEPAAGDFLVGPYTLPGTPLFHSTTELYVGKATRNLRSVA